MSVSWPHVRLYVFTHSYYPWLLFGQCLVCVTRLLAKITETVLFFSSPCMCYERPSWLYRKSLFTTLDSACLRALPQFYLVCPRKGLSCQEDGEIL